MPPALLEEVFALNEELDEVRDLRGSGAPADVWRARLERARQPIEAKRAEHEAQLQDLSARWDALGASESDRARDPGGAARPHARAELHHEPAGGDRTGATS